MDQNKGKRSYKDVTEVEVAVVKTDAAPHAPKSVYAEEISEANNASAALINGAAEINVLDSDYKIKIDYVHEFTGEDSEVKVEVVDYFGHAIASASAEKAEDSDKWEISFVFAKHPVGYFTVRVNGEIVHFYVVTPSFNKRTVDDSPFAMDAAFTELLFRGSNRIYLQSYGAAMRLCGVNWIRERFQWRDYQPGNDNEVYTYNNEYMAKVKERFKVLDGTGLKMLMIMSTAPEWALEKARSLPESEILSGKRNTLGTYGSQLAAYDAAKNVARELCDYIDIIELINEPDHPAFRDLAEYYASWFKSAALGVIDAGTDMKISMTGLCANPNNYEFIPILLENDVIKYCSIFNYHTHIYEFDFNNNDFVPDYGSNIVAREYATLRDLYDIDKPMWISESGLKIPSTVPSEEQKIIQTPYIVTGAVQAISLGNDKYFWFVAAPYEEQGGDFSSFSLTNKPYPTVAAYAVMTDILGEGKYIGELKSLPSDDARGYLFKTGNGDETVAVVWMTTGKALYTVPTGAKVTNMMGQEVISDGEVELSINPIYITYQNTPADYYKHSVELHKEYKLPVVDESDYVIITPEFADFNFSQAIKLNGHQIKTGSVVKVRVVNHSDKAVTGKIDVTIPEFTVDGLDREVTVKPHSEEFITLTLTQNGERDMDDFVTFTGVFNGKACTPATVSVYSGELKSRKISRSNWNIEFDKTLPDASSLLSCVTTEVSNFIPESGKVTIMIGGEEFKNFTFGEKKVAVEDSNDYRYVLEMDLSGLSDGKHIVSIGFKSHGGDMRVLPLVVRYDKAANTVVFANKR